MNHDVKVYTTTYCAYCNRAKSLLEKKGISYQQIDVTNDPDARSWLVRETGRKTVPQIFIDGKPIGGYEELRSLDRAGELDHLSI